MATTYEVFAKCPDTGKTVRTGYKVKKPEFGGDERPCGAYNCVACGNSHSWSYDDEDIKIHLVAE